MLRAEHCIAGTSTTGTGTLTLAACPSPPGGTDFYQAFSAQSLTGSILVSYCIIEYTSGSFTTAMQQEKGIGTLALGGSITATTLARTTVQQTAVDMDTSTPTYSVGSPSALTIGTAANTLVFIGASATDIPAWLPYTDTTSTTFGALPMQVPGSAGSFTIADDSDYYCPFSWAIPMLVKRLRVVISTASSGGTNAMLGRIYSIGTDALPDRLLYNFGTFSGSNVISSASGTPIRTQATGSGIFLMPGEYYVNIHTTQSGGSIGNLQAASIVLSGRGGLVSGGNSIIGYSASTATTVASDPALSSLTALTTGSPFQFMLAAS